MSTLRKRRTFLYELTLISGGLMGGIASSSCDRTDTANSLKIETVNGTLSPLQMGCTLTHEHVFSQFGAPPQEPAVYNEEKLMAQVVPYLEKIKSLGCDTLIDCTAACFGRAPQVLKQLAEATGLQLITNTGYYGAADDRYVPKRAYDATLAEIARVWIDEHEKGIGDTGIKPGFVKLAVDGGPLSEIDAKLIRAGAIAHKETGLTLAVHTGENPEAAFSQLKILKEEGVSPQAWIWTHANKNSSVEPLIEAARQGAWISLDGIRSLDPIALQEGKQDPIGHHLSFIQQFKEKNLLERVLLSHDGNSFPGGGAIRPYEALFTIVIPLLKESGFSQTDIDQLTRVNPKEAFIIRVR